VQYSILLFEKIFAIISIQGKGKATSHRLGNVLQKNKKKALTKEKTFDIIRVQKLRKPLQRVLLKPMFF
jgi:hypothetical protein